MLAGQKQSFLLFLWLWSLFSSQNRRPEPDTNAGAQRHVSRAELWEILRHIEVSKAQIRPTPGTFYFCFSDSPGHTQLGDLLNKTPPSPPRDLEVNKHYRLINKVWQNCRGNVARRQQMQQLGGDVVAVLLT